MALFTKEEALKYHEDKRRGKLEPNLSDSPA